MVDFFVSLLVNEVDLLIGKFNIVMNGVDGLKVIIRDFGKWIGVSLIWVLEEVCCLRDLFVWILYYVFFDIVFVN